MSKVIRGRPIDKDKQWAQRQLLMEAAEELLKEKCFHSITTREIAEKAGMESAMISYYFDNKEGLFIALIERSGDISLARMVALFESEQPIREFIRTVVSELLEKPSLYRFISDEILFLDCQLSQLIINTLHKKVATFLPMLIKYLQAKNEIRADIDSRWAAFSLMNMILMPFMYAKNRDTASPVSHDEVSSSDWVDHIYHLFIAGCDNLPSTLPK